MLVLAGCECDTSSELLQQTQQSSLCMCKPEVFPLTADAVPKGGQHAGKLHVEDFLDIKKTQLKGAKAESVTDKNKVRGQHSDGAPLICSVQGVDKHGDGLRQAHPSHTVFNSNQPCFAELLGKSSHNPFACTMLR